MPPCRAIAPRERSSRAAEVPAATQKDEFTPSPLLSHRQIVKRLTGLQLRDDPFGFLTPPRPSFGWFGRVSVLGSNLRIRPSLSPAFLFRGIALEQSKASLKFSLFFSDFCPKGRGDFVAKNPQLVDRHIFQGWAQILTAQMELQTANRSSNVHPVWLIFSVRMTVPRSDKLKQMGDPNSNVVPNKLAGADYPRSKTLKIGTHDAGTV